MKVNKIELKERTFIPYEVVITVESEEEHIQLKRDIHNTYYSNFRLRDILRKARAIDNLFDSILHHTK